MKEIDVSTPNYPNTYVLVDDDDYIWLSKWKWTAKKDGNCVYASRKIRTADNKRYMLLMHRDILGLKKGDRLGVDHINHNGLDNRKSNIRICTSQQNCFNRRSHLNSASQYKGICLSRNGRWRARIFKEGRLLSLGSFISEIDAALAYNKNAQELFGEFACLNNINTPEPEKIV